MRVNSKVSARLTRQFLAGEQALQEKQSVCLLMEAGHRYFMELDPEALIRLIPMAADLYNRGKISVALYLTMHRCIHERIEQLRR
jgi:hypothetical protein